MEHHEWGWMIVVYLFLGGLGAGSLVLSAAAFLSGRTAYRGIVRAGALAAPVLVGSGSGLLVFDLGQPIRAWRLFAVVNPVSPMSVGSWLLLLFLGVASIHAVLHLPSQWPARLAERWSRAAAPLRALATWNRTAETGGGLPEGAAATYPDSPDWVRRLRSAAAVVGIPLGLGVGIYTGVLLGAIPARPFWNTPMVAQLFLFSALSGASALLLLLAPRFAGGDEDSRALQHGALLRADLVFIFLELFLVIPFVVHGQLSVLSAKHGLDLILGGPYTVPFWLGAVALGILVPGLLEALDVAGALRRAPRAWRRAVHLVAPVLILFGGYLLRWVFVHAGQDSVFL